MLWAPGNYYAVFTVYGIVNGIKIVIRTYKGFIIFVIQIPTKQLMKKLLTLFVAYLTFSAGVYATRQRQQQPRR
jgi:hypothetical protein